MYRVVQEALTNAFKHAGPKVSGAAVGVAAKGPHGYLRWWACLPMIVSHIQYHCRGGLGGFVVFIGATAAMWLIREQILIFGRQAQHLLDLMQTSRQGESGEQSLLTLNWDLELELTPTRGHRDRSRPFAGKGWRI